MVKGLPQTDSGVTEHLQMLTVVPMRMLAILEVSKGCSRGCFLPVTSSRTLLMPSRGASL